MPSEFIVLDSPLPLIAVKSAAVVVVIADAAVGSVVPK